MKKIARKTVKASPVRPPASNALENDPTDNLSFAEIKELIELISQKQFDEFELERGRFRLRAQKGVARTGSESGTQPVSVEPVVVESRPIDAQAPATPVVSAKPEPAPAPAAPEEELHIITSPIVGTFFRAPSPTAEPFVKLGDPVEAGTTICIIEAMKLMNEIQSDASGTVVKTFVENGQPVEVRT
jgi:acetyl-CoA carboxylase biotin carboxyl carrier protein